jgi:NAD-dependent dihydropyrimidine dehydrogenase PreA subunit
VEVRIHMVIKTFQDEVTIKIDYDKCNGAAECVNACPASVYELADGKSIATNIADCTQCCICINVCPTGAIEHSHC